MSQDIQLNLINSKSSGRDVLFRNISSSNYREVDMKYITPVIIVSFSNYLTVTYFSILANKNNDAHVVFLFLISALYAEYGKFILLLCIP